MVPPRSAADVTATRHPTPLASRDYQPSDACPTRGACGTTEGREIFKDPAPPLYFQYQLRSLEKMRNPNLHLHPGAPTVGLHIDDGQGVRAQQMKNPEKDTVPPSPSNSAASSQAQFASPHRGAGLPPVFGGL
jgi:hypothetical protein